MVRTELDDKMWMLWLKDCEGKLRWECILRSWTFTDLFTNSKTHLTLTYTHRPDINTYYTEMNLPKRLIYLPTKTRNRNLVWSIRENLIQRRCYLWIPLEVRNCHLVNLWVSNILKGRHFFSWFGRCQKIVWLDLVL